MVISIIRILLIAVHTFILSIITTVVVVLTRNATVFDACLHVFFSGLLYFGGVKVKTEGAENVDFSRNYIYVANHASYFDIPSSVIGIPGKHIRIMYKKEMQKIPVFGWAMKWTRFYIPVNRGRGVEAQQSLDTAIQRIKDGESVLLFAEGTRTSDGKLQGFKRGAFNIAIKAGIPVVPVIINGSRLVLAKDSFQINPGTVTIVIEKPILPPSENGKASELELMNAVRQKIEQHYINQ